MKTKPESKLRITISAMLALLLVSSINTSAASAIEPPSPVPEMAPLSLRQSTWRLPVDPDNQGLIHLVNPYRQPNSDYSAGHRGVDYRAAMGETIFSPAAGTIAFLGRVANRYLLTIKHESNLVSEFEPVCSTLSVGNQVQSGEPIGVLCNVFTGRGPVGSGPVGDGTDGDETAGYTWHCPEACLHFSLRSEGRYLSPLSIIGGLSPSRLLPLGRID